MFNTSEIQHETCDICGSGLKPKVMSRDIGFGKFDIDLCEKCGFAQVNPTPSQDYIVDFYRSFGGHSNSSQVTYEQVLENEKSSPNSSIDAKRIATNLHRLSRGKQLLDVGCGYGFFSRAAKERGFEVNTIELAEHEAHISSQMTGVTPVNVPFEAFTTDKTYDAIIMSQVLEHAREPKAWLAHARSMMHTGGVIALAYPNFESLFTKVLKERDPYVIPPAHLNHFGPRSTKLILEETGFKVEKMETISRLPATTFTKRFGMSLGRVLHPLANTILKPMDLAKVGVMINVYGRAV